MNRPGPPLSPDRWHQIEALFERALDVPAEQRAELLRQACGDDAELRAQVERLLEAEQASAGFLAEPAGRRAASLLEGLAAEWTTGPARGEDGTGARFGPYQVLEEIGAGGMSRVYRAVRDDGVFAQTVALKVLRPFGAQREERERRFRVERHLLASLEHPGIARILDGGTGPGGSQYLAMELVDGLPLDRYCAERGLDVAARLRLVVEICAAVQYAHQRLIVHRDLKPANILVGPAGVKVADFGLAQLGPDAAVTTLTRTDVAMGTFHYLAPEQRKDARTVDHRADIWALGVILYELVTGELPLGSFPPPTDRRIAAIVRRALAPDPAGRQASAVELGRELRALVATPARRRALALAAAALMVVAGAAGAVVALGGGGGRGDAGRSGAGEGAAVEVAGGPAAVAGTPAAVSGEPAAVGGEPAAADVPPPDVAAARLTEADADLTAAGSAAADAGVDAAAAVATAPPRTPPRRPVGVTKVKKPDASPAPLAVCRRARECCTAVGAGGCAPLLTGDDATCRAALADLRPRASNARARKICGS